MCVISACAAGRRGQRIPEWYLFWLAIKLLHLIETNYPLSQWNAPGSFYFFLLYDLSMRLAAVCWVMLRFRNWDTVHSTGPFILLLWMWGGQRAPTQTGEMLLTGSWYVFEEWNYSKRKKKGALPWGRGNVEVLKGWSWCLEVEKEICFRSSLCMSLGFVFCFHSSAERSFVQL